MKKIAIVGCGFSGTMTAVHLINNAVEPFELILIGDQDTFNKGVAYTPNSRNQILNVVDSRMSAYPDDPGHFLNWVSTLEEYSATDKGLLANSYLPRYLYGKYLEDIWHKAVQAPGATRVKITRKDSLVTDMDYSGQDISLQLKNGEQLVVQYGVIASGNHQPANPAIEDSQVFNSNKYFRNPWTTNVFSHTDKHSPVMILGNGLTMADTVLGLIENGFTSRIYTISSHGFSMLPHKHLGIAYNAVAGELQGNPALSDLVRILTRHIRIARRLGFTAEPVVDGLRPLTQQLWQNLSAAEKQKFMSRLRYLWDTARHRIPMHIHEKLVQLTETGALELNAGKLISITETGNAVKVRFVNHGSGETREITVSSVINCTGPATDLMKTDDNYLKRALQKGIIVQDALLLGILADPATFCVCSNSFEPHDNLFTIGSLLKGVLWETTAVKELREQAAGLAAQLVRRIH
jgi:uncharacterized NAD(P)/FAD-binding protein YdhS